MFSSHVVGVIYTPVVAVRFLASCLHISVVVVRVLGVLDIPVVIVTFLLSEADFETVTSGRFVSTSVPSQGTMMQGLHAACSRQDLQYNSACFNVHYKQAVFLFSLSATLKLRTARLKFTPARYSRSRLTNQMTLYSRLFSKEQGHGLHILKTLLNFIFSILDHPCSFMVYCYLFGVDLSQ